MIEQITTALKKFDPLALEGLQAIVLFDDIRFDNNDYDVIGPKVRDFIHEELTRLDFERLTGTRYQHESLQLVFPKASHRLGSGLLDGLPSSDQPEWVFLTPSQALALAISRDLAHGELLKELGSHHLINMEKVRDFCQQEHHQKWLSDHWATMKDYQIIAAAKPRRTGRF